VRDGLSRRRVHRWFARWQVCRYGRNRQVESYPMTAASTPEMKGWILAALLLSGIPDFANASDATHPVRAELVADVETVGRGAAFHLGVVLKMDPGWHTYWQYSGDAGIPTQVDWKLPRGFSAGPLRWPIPKKYTEAGDLTVYGYTDEVLLFSEVQAPATSIADTLLFEAAVSWLVCREICIPGGADVSLTIPVNGSGAAPANAGLFERYSARVPLEEGAEVGLTVSHGVADTPEGVQVNLAVRHDLSREARAVEFLPLDLDGFEFSTRAEPNGELRLSLKPYADRELQMLAGVLQYSAPSFGERSVHVSLNLETDPEPGRRRVAPGAFERLPLATYLLMAIVGGFILNLMPCVLPVISLKVMGIVSHAGADRSRVRALGLAFAGGIELTFLGLAAIVLALKLAGEQIGWGFQFQYPQFVVFMAALVFALGLSLFGVFTVNVRSSGGRGSATDGLLGSFSNGVLATILATPCTAPFLGTALGFAFSQSGPMVALLFATIGVGMALPYLLLALKPDWTRWLPKPGPWMEQLKQLMGFLLMATVVWLLWVLGNQLGLEGVIWTISFLLALGLACWMIGSWIDLRTSRSKRRFVWGLSTMLVVTAYVVLLHPMLRAERVWATVGETGAGGQVWEPYSPERLDRLLGEGRIVFIDFTAEWCWTCKINERAVLEDSKVQTRFEELAVAMLKADWTNRNPEITRLLRSFGRSGVPLYVLYPGKGRDPIVLPELITSSIVLESLQSAEGG
jgi:thiol:disulfide interchange protein/DsbC/DsbD-like thiol-disulfide interchange protein